MVKGCLMIVGLVKIHVLGTKLPSQACLCFNKPIKDTAFTVGRNCLLKELVFWKVAIAKIEL